SATAATQRGLMRLYAITELKELRMQVRHLPGLGDAKLRLAPIVPAAEFERALVGLLARKAFVEGEPPVRTREAFDAVRAQRARRIAEAACEIAPWLPSLADAYHAARRGWESLSPSTAGPLLADVKQQVQWLTAPEFLSIVPW